MGQQSQHHLPGIIVRSQQLWEIFVNHSLFSATSTVAHLITMTSRHILWKVYKHLELPGRLDTKLLTEVLPDRQGPKHSGFILGVYLAFLNLLQ